MDSPSTNGVTIKTEPGTQEGHGSEMPYTDMEIHNSDIKEECLENNERINQTAGNNKTFLQEVYCLLCITIQLLIHNHLFPIYFTYLPP